ncbi:hypothetical protein LPJ64_000836 [Coemansia asiatica]|uniref:Uncharacterized protein n=1 Tax=Coemansia asiatica TaxID=1052880 RepID=A0A9W7XMC8_9FUNG|nr:hypothetical protein LPJ64_000836 [Coemansia asiatica]
MVIAIPITAHIARKDDGVEDPPSSGLFSFLLNSDSKTRSTSTPTHTPTSTDDSSDSNNDNGNDSANRDTIEAAVAACETPLLVCEAGQIRVLNISQGSCNWSCQRDPYYKKTGNNKGSVIGGSVGATAGVLIVLLALLLFTQAKKRRRERATYDKDTADLASELSDLPLIQNSQRQGSHQQQQQSSSSSTTVPNSSDGSSFQRWRTQTSAWVVPRAPRPEEAGTELTMDIVDRPPESDPTLAAFEGALPYRQEKTAAAYPLLAEFSHENKVSSHGRVVAAATGAGIANGELSETSAGSSGTASLKQRRLLKKKHQVPASNNGYPEIVSPEEQLLYNYQIARYSGDAAIAAAQESAGAGTPIMTAFNPFNAVPSVRSLPFDDGVSQPTVSRKHSDKSNKSSL